MEIKDIIVKSDFINLTNQEIDKIIKILDIELNDKEDPRQRLFDNIDLIFKDNKAKDVLLSKIFAGRKSVKWFKIIYVGNDNIENYKDLLIKKIESDEYCFDKIKSINNKSLESPSLYTCIKLDDNKYIMRFMIPCGTKTYNDGQDYSKFKNINNVVVIVDLNCEYLEIRTNSKDATRIANQLMDTFKAMYVSIRDLDVLKNYNGSLEKFKSSLYNGNFAQSLSIPDKNLKLTEENNELLVNMLIVIDDYFGDKDIKKFNDKVQALNIDTDGTPFTELLLAGMASIGLKIRKDCEEDLSKQTLYNVLKKYITNYSGLIKFSDSPVGEIYTISVGLKTLSIFFKSSVSEKTIKYIRQKVL
ncbi:hypothetical protein GTH52_06915 [Clostridium tyrobutyricum]|uniref:Uncharacterized protein n=1 Tax=Clostridium tyrobutyricum DIVETGP TaxID=1408889 RepID=W6N4H6_CLOTY|nr:hypothetical protein [Clostridium tyrobutyricum]ANP69013.1 hypothetical protein BA182_04790 [Clostridium tyrobutyricum]MBV4435381.1 hypothetical protein [Clostridium tyrobutyricum]QNB66637.1 hypothetical protein GTH52_06915 [Clostridium tyrobutyricum]CDL91448.1 hypothetical protein CTDIVETGP_1518 [Clostridium tyrobutyricum DIVETGP]